MFPIRNERRGLCSRPSPGSGFYLHKDFGAAEVGILSAQRMSRGRDFDFIYATNSARPGSDVDLHKRFMGPWFNTKLVSRMGAIVNTTSALRALVLQNLLRTMSEL